MGYSMINHPALLRTDLPHVVFQECPGDIALYFSFYGCPLRCEGCHSPELWENSGGEPLSITRFQQYLDQYEGLVTAVVMFGGEWLPLELQSLLIEVQKRGLNSYLYSGLNNVSRHLLPHLDFVKLGSWRTSQGGLSDPKTNQRFYHVVNGQLAEDQTFLFQTNSSHTNSSHSNSSHTNSSHSNSSHTNKDAYHVAA
mgnify:FL=1